MTQMIRQHFLLPLPLDERIKLVARQDHKSEAEVIRELLESGLQTKHQPTGSVGHALRELAQIGKEAGATGPTDLSQASQILSSILSTIADVLLLLLYQ